MLRVAVISAALLGLAACGQEGMEPGGAANGDGGEAAATSPEMGTDVVSSCLELVRRGEFDAALPACREAAQQRPESQEVSDALEKALQETGSAARGAAGEAGSAVEGVTGEGGEGAP